jgi:hypothetical protein
MSREHGAGHGVSGERTGDWLRGVAAGAGRAGTGGGAPFARDCGGVSRVSVELGF